MPCPTCNATMQNLGLKSERMFWCPRCGTLFTPGTCHEATEAPRWAKLMWAPDGLQAIADELEAVRRSVALDEAAKIEEANP